MLKDKSIILCDVDGVLIHTQDNKRWSTSLKEDWDIDFDVLQEKFFSIYWDDIIRGRRHLEECLKTVLPQINPNVSAERLITYWFEKDSNIDHRILKLLKKYKENGYTLYISTDQEHLRKKYLYEKLGLNKVFSDVFYSADFGFVKNESGFWEQLKNKLNHYPVDQMFFIDDREVNVEMAKKHGIDGYTYTKLSAKRLKSGFPLEFEALKV